MLRYMVVCSVIVMVCAVLVTANNQPQGYNGRMPFVGARPNSQRYYERINRVPGFGMRPPGAFKTGKRAPLQGVYDEEYTE